jgi:hypothetical protein
MPEMLQACQGQNNVASYITAKEEEKLKHSQNFDIWPCTETIKDIPFISQY